MSACMLASNLTSLRWICSSLLNFTLASVSLASPFGRVTIVDFAVIVNRLLLVALSLQNELGHGAVYRTDIHHQTSWYIFTVFVARCSLFKQYCLFLQVPNCLPCILFKNTRPLKWNRAFWYRDSMTLTFIIFQRSNQ